MNGRNIMLLLLWWQHFSIDGFCKTHWVPCFEILGSQDTRLPVFYETTQYGHLSWVSCMVSFHVQFQRDFTKQI